ncbi:MAG: citryl-CoA lyase [Candidatus Aminicenantes bacterium RBG_13_59_9]|nr:MAG: citryl-CoA lyase [Candidatus Aminicenantes bacterium RBG_13_59_9]
MSELHWKTGITEVEPNKIRLRGYPLDELMGRITFSQAIYLALRGELPTPEIGRLIDAIFVSSIDHGASPPSVLTARTVASTGAEMNSAVAAGVLAINRFHGGAVEEGMVLFRNISRRAKDAKTGLRQAAAEILKDMKDKGRRASGFGHRIHTHDPRTERLFALAEEAGASGEFIRIARDCEEILKEQTGKPLPINVDGAIAAVLCELGFPSEIGNAFFIIARVPGLVAHIQEEKTRMRPMRKIHPEDFAYDGPRRKE